MRDVVRGHGLTTQNRVYGYVRKTVKRTQGNQHRSDTRKEETLITPEDLMPQATVGTEIRLESIPLTRCVCIQ